MEVDKAEGSAWVCYPEYMKEEDEHDSYPVKLTEEIEEIRQGKVHRLEKFQRGGVPP